MAAKRPRSKSRASIHNLRSQAKVAKPMPGRPPTTCKQAKDAAKGRTQRSHWEKIKQILTNLMVKTTGALCMKIIKFIMVIPICPLLWLNRIIILYVMLIGIGRIIVLIWSLKRSKRMDYCILFKMEHMKTAEGTFLCCSSRPCRRSPRCRDLVMVKGP